MPGTGVRRTSSQGEGGEGHTAQERRGSRSSGERGWESAAGNSYSNRPGARSAGEHSTDRLDHEEQDQHRHQHQQGRLGLRERRQRRRKRQQRSRQKQQLQSADFLNNGCCNGNGNDDSAEGSLVGTPRAGSAQFPKHAGPSLVSCGETADGRSTNGAPDSGNHGGWSARAGHSADRQAQEKQKPCGTGRGGGANGERLEITFKPVAGERVRNRSRSRSNIDDTDAPPGRVRSGSAAQSSRSRAAVPDTVERGGHGRVVGEPNVGEGVRAKGLESRAAASAESRFRRRRRRKSKDSGADDAVLLPGQKYHHPIADTPVSNPPHFGSQYVEGIGPQETVVYAHCGLQRASDEYGGVSARTNSEN